MKKTEPTAITRPLCVWLAATVLSLLPNLAAAQGITKNWMLVPNECSGVESRLAIPCGTVGVYHVGVSSLGSCTPSISLVTETLKPYPKSVAAKPWTSSFATGSAPAVTIIDFGSGSHGSAVKSLIASLIGGANNIDFRAIDASNLVPALGATPTDLHILANVCGVLDPIENFGATAPSVLNLSFGRKWEAGDPTDSTCISKTAACELAKRLQSLKAHGTAIVAAAGQHREDLLPARFNSTIPAGMADIVPLIQTGVTQAAWETPLVTPKGLFIGNSLCLGDGRWPAPAGSSFSAATLSGLIAKAKQADPTFDPYAPGIYTARRLGAPQGPGDYALFRDNTQVAPGLPALTSLYVGLGGNPQPLCWAGNHPDIYRPDTTTASFAPRDAVAFPTFVATTIEPTPGEDPCLPCIGDDFPPGGANLSINMSQSVALGTYEYVDSAKLKVNNSYYAINLSSPGNREAIKYATLQQLIINNGYALVNITPPPQVSMIITIKTITAGQSVPAMNSCTQGATNCHWTSTPVTMLP